MLVAVEIVITHKSSRQENLLDTPHDDNMILKVRDNCLRKVVFRKYYVH